MKLHYEVRGAGPPVLILHGLFGSHQNWLPVARELSGAFRVIAADLRNHGRSPHHSDTNYAIMAGDVQHLLQELDLENVALIGHSLGGKVAMQLALTHPTVVSRLIVVDIAPRAYRLVHDEIFTALRQLDLNNVHSRTQADELLAASIPHRGTRHFLLTNLVRLPGGGWRWRVNLDGLHANREQLTGALQGEPFSGPALFIRGERSDYVTETDLADLRRLFSQAEWVTIPGAGHWVHVDAPEPFVKAVRSFLERSPG
jgi:pimeloyl-ACP methyl ester carboxylesterase